MPVAYALQVILISIAVILSWHWQGVEAATAALYGGTTALSNVALLLWRWRRGSHDYHCDVGRHLKQFRRSSLERFFVVTMLLVAGLAGLKLEPLPLLLGFIVGQLAWMVAALALKTD